MNWLGAGLASFFAAIVGTLLGAVLRFEASRFGIDFPPLVGIVARGAAAVASRAPKFSGLRGVLVASFSVWAAAIGEVLVHPDHGLASDLLHFSDRLSVTTFVAYAVAALLLGSRALRGPASPAPRAQAGTLEASIDVSAADSRPGR